MTNRIAIRIMLGLLSAVVIFHVCIITKIIPYETTWGGGLQNDSEMYVFETSSIIINLFLGFVLLMKSGYMKPYFKPSAVHVILWIYLILFALNTIGNLLAKTNFEKSFAALTLVFAMLIWVILNPKRNQKTMFTAEQIKAAHSKVKSGADFPVYIQEIKALGVTHYEAYVTDGHIDYHGANGYTAKVPAKYAPLDIADTAKREQFKADLAAHQQGKTDFLTFIKACATSGIEKWAICMDKMTCTYYDKTGTEMLVEEIPQ